MTSNQIAITEGAGKNVATETIGTVDYGIVKVADGRTGSTSVMTVFRDGSIPVSVIGAITIGTHSVAGTVGASVIGQAPVVGTTFEDAPHTSGDPGFFALGVRNETLASITSTDLDYSPQAVGPSGEQITVNAPYTKWVQGNVNLSPNGGASVAVIAPQGSSIFTYVTGVQIANMGSASVLVTFSGATSSVVGYSIAPAGGGSNIMLPNAWKTNANGAFTASISAQASVYVSAQGFISKT